MKEHDLKQAALVYHREPTPGKIGIAATKPLANQRDLALAYSPGVAAACDAIEADPNEAAALTARGNLIAVITNGTAVLGLGAIGPLAAKPVMEGKAVLFKKFAGIDVFDIEVAETDPDKLIEIVASLEPTFGGINLEDIKAPECFEVETRLKERLRIPVFHDDQHGTAIIVGAAFQNGLELVGKNAADVKVVSTGGGAAGIACLDLMRRLGVRRENVTLVDRLGVVYAGRKEEMDPKKAAYAIPTEARTLDEVIDGADVFLGLSAPGILTPEMAKRMAPKALIFALANPVPEILPEVAREACPDAIIATGRTDYPNQVNNVLCFPFLFRGALDAGATTINEEMKLACVHALANLAKAETSDVVAQAYGGESLAFGPDYLIPKPFDPRLILELAPAVARAAMESGVATRPIEDFAVYHRRLEEFVFRSGLVMKPVIEQARRDPKRVVYAEGEDERVLRAVQVVCDEGIARPILVGRPRVVAARAKKLGLRIEAGTDFELINPEDDPRYNKYWGLYHELVERKGVSPDEARTVVRTNATVIAALALRRDEADAMLCGAVGRYTEHLRHILHVIGVRAGVRAVSALGMLILPKGTFFICDTYIKPNPNADDIAEMVMLGAAEIRRLGVEPKVALLSHSSFGTATTESARKMRRALVLLRERAPDVEVEGEMHADAALNEEIRGRIFPNSRLRGAANFLVMPNLDAANIAYNMVKVLGEGVPVGPILLGAARSAHILTPSVTARGLVNMSAVAVTDAQAQAATGANPEAAT